MPADVEKDRLLPEPYVTDALLPKCVSSMVVFVMLPARHSGGTPQDAGGVGLPAESRFPYPAQGTIANIRSFEKEHSLH
jgi:hypothetical protein